jgi:hypothetical protein
MGMQTITRLPTHDRRCCTAFFLQQGMVPAREGSDHASPPGQTPYQGPGRLPPLSNGDTPQQRIGLQRGGDG